MLCCRCEKRGTREQSTGNPRQNYLGVLFLEGAFAKQLGYTQKRDECLFLKHDDTINSKKKKKFFF